MDNSLVRELLEYVQHTEQCICSQWRQGKPTPDGGYETLYGYGSNAKWYKRDEEPDCTCGLTNIIRKLGVTYDQP